MSDTQSLASEDSAAMVNGASIFVEIEAVGKLNLGEGFILQQPQKKFVVQDGLLALLLGDEATVVVGDIRPDRSTDDWILHGRVVLPLPLASPANGGRCLDLALVQSQDKAFVATLVLLAERKNKERFLASYPIRYTGRVYELGDEASVYDKSNVLGKGISTITSDQESIFTVSNLVRKIKVEGSESCLRPTTARAQVPNDCLDGTLSLGVLSSSSKKQGTKTNSIILASKTKSAGKNKYAIEWYTCNKKDELSLVKGSSMRLHEDSEPISVLVDPRDGRSVFVIYNNRSSGNSSLVKLTKSSASGVITTWDFLVSTAGMGWINDDLTVVLSCEGSNQPRMFSVAKTDGHRSKQQLCAECSGLQMIQSPAHLISMVTNKWRLTSNIVDDCLAKSTTVAMASLCVNDNVLVSEPESGNFYRIRAVGCPIRGLHAEAMILEDVERCFDGDFGALSQCVLKICQSSKPCSACISLMSSWCKSDKIGAIEVYYVRNDSSDEMSEQLQRLALKGISAEKFRSLVIDTDWTTVIHQRPATALTESTCDGGTFTLEPETSSNNGESMKASLTQRPMSASVCSSGSRSSFNSRIPMPKSSTIMNTSSLSATSHNEEEDLVEANQRLRGLVQRLTATLSTILDVDVALRNNLMSMHEIVTEVQEEIAHR